MSLLKLPRFEGCPLLRVRECPNYLDLAQIHIAPTYQGRGIGTQIMLYVKMLAEVKRKPIRLQAVAPEEQNQARLEAFYRRHGFKPVTSPLPHLMEWQPET